MLLPPAGPSTSSTCSTAWCWPAGATSTPLLRRRPWRRGTSTVRGTRPRSRWSGPLGCRRADARRVPRPPGVRGRDGGTLVADVAAHLPDSAPVRTTPGSLVGASSVHEPRSIAAPPGGHDPGPCWRVTARADDGVVEAVEWDDRAWPALGVQWHPELQTTRASGSSAGWSPPDGKFARAKHARSSVVTGYTHHRACRGECARPCRPAGGPGGAGRRVRGERVNILGFQIFPGSTWSLMSWCWTYLGGWMLYDARAAGGAVPSVRWSASFRVPRRRRRTS